MACLFYIDHINFLSFLFVCLVYFLFLIFFAIVLIFLKASISGLLFQTRKRKSNVE